MEVEAQIYVWTVNGMRRTNSDTGYVETAEVERLLEEAHRRAYEQGLEAGRRQSEP